MNSESLSITFHSIAASGWVKISVNRTDATRCGASRRPPCLST